MTEYIGSRYVLHDMLGQGGMGVVYRATDRLSGQSVALKRVHIPGRQNAQVFPNETIEDLRAPIHDTDEETDSFRIALAQEFQTLATLRHPHIISVLDYGFDANRQPYFTMDLLEGAKTILQAGRDQPLDTQIELLVQMVQALAYLHRRGIIHRDLKPDNVLVTDGGVRLLDFGLAAARERIDTAQEGSLSGTFAYMAPEILQGAPATEVSDLYAVGIIAYELIVGQHPFNTSNPASLINDILTREPDFSAVEAGGEVADILMQLLEKAPEDRFFSAQEVLYAYAEAAGRQDLLRESEAIRESFLQAAQFVGREEEFAALSSALKTAMKGRGSAWLVGGESGVGKSRLLDELRIKALVSGALALKGQAVSEGAAPYILWRDVIRHLALHVELNDLEAGVLQQLVQGIAQLLGREVPDAPELDPEAARDRLMVTIEGVFRRALAVRPIVLLLEDLQWAGESLLVLARLSRLVQKGEALPLLIVASYRDDERPGLPSELPDRFQTLKLDRLTKEDIEDLSASMLGEITGRRKRVVDLLTHETEGNAFFIVEVVRALAEEAGQLEDIGKMTLPKQVFAGGMKMVIRRRLNQVPDDARDLLRTAAVAGRWLDLDLLDEIAEKDLEAWLTTCADASVLDVYDGRWRFAHDKLREAFLDELSPDAKRAQHLQVAQAIETLYADDPTQTVALAHHWAEAGDTEKESHYTALAGEQALHLGVNNEAIAFLDRALALHEDLGAPESERARLIRLLAEAHFGLGSLPETRRYLEQAAALLGKPFPGSAGRLALDMVGQLIRQMQYLTLTPRPLKDKTKRMRWFEIARVYERLLEVYFFTNDTLPSFYSSLRAVNAAERLGPSPDLAILYGTMCVAVGYVPLHPLARHYRQKALRTLDQIEGDELAELHVTLGAGVYGMGAADWERADTFFTRGMELAEKVGERRRWGEHANVLASSMYFQGEYARSLAMHRRIYESALDANNLLHQGWSLVNQAMCYLRMGRDPEEIVHLLQAALRLMERNNDNISEVNCRGMLAAAYIRLGEYDLARAEADAGAPLTKSAPTSPTVFEGYAGIPEAYLTLWRRGDESLAPLAWQMCKNLGNFARVYAVGRPRALLCRGMAHDLSGETAKARRLWEESLETAAALHMPFEEGLAHYQIGRYDPDHMQQAAAIFSRLGADHDMARVQEEIHP